MKPSDYELIRQIKEKVRKLPDLQIPPEGAYIIIETDGCMEGWGAICKWKKKKGDSIGTEQVCAYASGRFKTIQSTIDAEIYACINALEKLKIYYLDQKEITLKTDCQAIISFYNKTNSNKASRVRWTKFTDAITGTGVQINIEHIEGKNNTLADALSRLVNFCLEVEEEGRYQAQEQAQRISTLTQEVLTNGSKKEQQLLAQMFEKSQSIPQPSKMLGSLKQAQRAQQRQNQAQMDTQPNEPCYSWDYATCYGEGTWATKGRTIFSIDKECQDNKMRAMRARY